MEKWIEKPPDDYLMYLPVWIRMRNIPVNHYTKDTIEEIAKCVGKVLEVEFDENKSQVQDYVRVRVLLHVSNSLRNSKAVQIPSGEVIIVSFDYERIRKRCFQCQRLTHDKNNCPFKITGPPKQNSEFLDDQGKGKGLLLQDTDQLKPEDRDTKLLMDARKGIVIQKVVSSPKLMAEEFSDDLQDLDIYTGFQMGICEASSSRASCKDTKPMKMKTIW